MIETLIRRACGVVAYGPPSDEAKAQELAKLASCRLEDAYLALAAAKILVTDAEARK